MSASEKAAVPFFVPRFWLLVGSTIAMKWRHRRRIDGAEYTDHLKQFYTRSQTRHVEVYGDAYKKVRPIIVRMADPQPGDRVLDMATGGGYQAAAFAGHGHHTIGMDYVHDRARLAHEQHGRDRLTWGVGDISQLPFKDKALDIVTITFALHDLPLDVQMRGLVELRRVARRRVVLAEPRAPKNPIGRFLFTNIGELLDESLHFRDFALRDFDSHLAEAGLRIVHTEPVYRGLAMVYVCEPE